MNNNYIYDFPFKLTQKELEEFLSTIPEDLKGADKIKDYISTKILCFKTLGEYFNSNVYTDYLQHGKLLDKKIYNDILHLQDTSYFLKLMDANMNNLPGKLKERYEEVSDREIKWCCLTLLEIPVTDILNVLDYKLEALNKMKTRLAAKLQLQSATELSIFLQGILSENY